MRAAGFGWEVDLDKDGGEVWDGVDVVGKALLRVRNEELGGRVVRAEIVGKGFADYAVADYADAEG